MCSICIAEPRRAVRTPANQVFCRECITLWLRHKPSCPNTQAPLTLADLRPVCPSDDAGDVELAVVAATPPRGSSAEPPSRGEQLLWVGVVPPVSADPERAPVALMRPMICLTFVAEMHVQVLVGVLSMHAYDSSGHVRQTILSNVGDLYASQPWRPFLAVYASSSVAIIVFNLAVQQMCLVLLLRRGVHWSTVLALQLVPALEANLLTAALMPARPLCGATVATTALLLRCVQEKMFRRQRWLGLCFTFFLVIIFVVGFRTNVTNVGHVYAVAWTIAHRALCRTSRRADTCTTFASFAMLFLFISAAPPIAHVFPRDARAVNDDAVSTHIGAACIIFGCETKGILF